MNIFISSIKMYKDINSYNKIITKCIKCVVMCIISKW